MFGQIGSIWNWRKWEHWSAASAAPEEDGGLPLAYMKFGRHIEFFRSGRTSYVVAYNDIAALTSERAFLEAWNECIQKATSEHARSMRALWTKVLSELADSGVRGAPQQRALRMYTAHRGSVATREVLAVVQELRALCIVNSEALRKLVKKWDKRSAARGAAALAPKLLPELYAASFASGTRDQPPATPNPTRLEPSLHRLLARVRTNVGTRVDSEGYTARLEHSKGTRAYFWLSCRVGVAGVARVGAACGAGTPR
jgi:hypothetical protein